MATSNTDVYKTQNPVFFYTMQIVYPTVTINRRVPWRDNFPTSPNSTEFVLIRSIGRQDAGLYTRHNGRYLLIAPYDDVVDSVAHDATFSIHIGTGAVDIPEGSHVYKNGVLIDVSSFPPDLRYVYCVITKYSGQDAVTSINGIKPDEHGNIDLDIPNPADFATAAQGAKADTAVQPGDLSRVATTGSYYDLTNLPVIPTRTSELENDSGFLVEVDLPTKTSQLENDSGYITAEAVPTKVSQLENDSGYLTETDQPIISIDGGNVADTPEIFYQIMSVDGNPIN